MVYLIDRIIIWAISQSWFWNIRTRLNQSRFYFEKNKYKQISTISKVQDSAKILRALAWIGLKGLFWVALSLAILYFSENYARRKLILFQYSGNFDNIFNIDQLRLYAQLLTAIFSIYFATIGIILSSGYTKLRRDIIQLLTTEQVGSVFSKVLVFSASFCLAATSLPFFGVEPGFFIYIVATFLTLSSSLALFPLGQRLFNFFDLHPLVGSEILPNIVKHIEEAANPRNSASLANHHSKVARAFLEQMSYIEGRLKFDKDRLEDNLLALTDDYSRLLMHYLQQKHKIDQTSYWFPRKRKHQQWFFAGDNATSLALETHNQLMVEERADFNWLETEIVGMLTGHIEIAFDNGNLNLALTLMNRLSNRILGYAKEFQFDVGMREIDKLRGLIEVAFEKHRNDTGKESQIIRIAIADTWAVFGSILCIETLRRMITFEKELTIFFEKDEWSAKSLRNLPPFLQVDIAFIVKCIDFEISVEGRRLSKSKYLRQLTVQNLLKRYASILSIVCEFYKKSVPDFAMSLLKLKLPEAATQVVLANLHNHWKLPKWLEELSQLFERYATYTHYREEQYVIPEIDVAGMVGDLAKARDEAIMTLGIPDLISQIFQGAHDDDLPDHYGQIYYELAEECVSALEQNQLDKFEKLINTFIPLALLAADYKFPDPKLDINIEFRLHLISTVINDLASVMGFAILYGAYFDNPKLSEAALERFFSIIDSREDQQQYLTRMLKLSNTNSFSSCASPRSLIRIKWKMAFEDRARHDGFCDHPSFDGGKNHKSNIVNEFIRSHSDASHLFFALKILPFVKPVNFDLDFHIKILAESLDTKKTKVAK